MVANRMSSTSAAPARIRSDLSSSGGSGFEIAPANEEDAGRVTRARRSSAPEAGRQKVPGDLRDRAGSSGAYSDNIQFPILWCRRGRTAPDQFGQRAVAALEIEVKPEDYTQAYKAIAGAFDSRHDVALSRRRRQSYAVLLFAPSTSRSICSNRRARDT